VVDGSIYAFGAQLFTTNPLPLPKSLSMSFFLTRGAVLLLIPKACIGLPSLRCPLYWFNISKFSLIQPLLQSYLARKAASSS